MRQLSTFLQGKCDMRPVTAIVGSRDAIGRWSPHPLRGKERKARREGLIASSQRVFLRLRDDWRDCYEQSKRRGARQAINRTYLQQLADDGQCTIDLEVGYEPATLPVRKYRVVLRSLVLRPGEIYEVGAIDGIYLLDPHRTGDFIEEVDPDEGRRVMARKELGEPEPPQSAPSPQLAAIVAHLQAVLADLREQNESLRAATETKPKRPRAPRPRKKPKE